MKGASQLFDPRSWSYLQALRPYPFHLSKFYNHSLRSCTLLRCSDLSLHPPVFPVDPYVAVAGLAKCESTYSFQDSLVTNEQLLYLTLQNDYPCEQIPFRTTTTLLHVLQNDYPLRLPNDIFKRLNSLPNDNPRKTTLLPMTLLWTASSPKLLLDHLKRSPRYVDPLTTLIRWLRWSAG